MQEGYMLKFTTYDITFRELPNEVALTVAVSSCPNRCKNCHSPELRRDIGIDIYEVLKLTEKYKDHITAVCLLGHGGSNHKEYLTEFLKIHKKEYPNIKLGLYSGFNEMWEEFKPYLDYYKVGEYKEELGGLDSPTTNQVIHKLT